LPRRGRREREEEGQEAPASEAFGLLGVSLAKQPVGVTRVDAKYQVKVSDVLAKVFDKFESGKIDGIYIVTREILADGRPTISYYRAAMTDMDVSWAAVTMLLEQHVERS